MYERSKKVLAGPSTFGKSPDQFAAGITPYALEKGKGAYVWDMDGNKYLDTMMSLGCVMLGYCEPHVEEAIKKQLEKGVSFSLAHSLEIEVAEMLCERYPCAEMVRFGKNGNDATSAAVRLARYHTGRDHVLFCGYHGWQDWYISQTSMSGGIPAPVKDFSHRFKYNDLEDLDRLFKEFKDKVACVIMEPVSRIQPKEGYLKDVQEMTRKNGAVLIFDEVVTGFRFSRGGYQAYSGTVPDLACLSKAMTNGMPLSAVIGKKEIMKKFPEIFFSLTTAGETLSLAAAKAVMEVIDKDKVPDKIRHYGQIFLDGMAKLIEKHALKDAVSVEGFPCRSVILFKEVNAVPAMDTHTYWIQELAKKGVLTAGYHIISHAHRDEEITLLLKNADAVFGLIKQGLSDGSLSAKLQCPTAKQGARSL